MNDTYGVTAEPCWGCAFKNALKAAKCTAVIALAVAGIGVPISKIVKVKRLVVSPTGVRG